MKKSRGILFALAVCASPASSLHAAGTAQRCAEIYDDAPRLACYDAQFGKPVRPGVAPSRTEIARPNSEPRAAEPRAVEPRVATTVAPTDAAAVAKPRNETVTGRIAAVKRIANDRFQVTLDNGQVWTQLERDLNAEVAVGDAVKLRPAMLGSWMLETRGGVRTRVRPAP